MNNVPIDSLRLHESASKVPMADASDLGSLRRSLAENGQQDPIDVTDDGTILDGRTRWSLLRDLGAVSILVRVVPIPPDQQTNYIVDRALARRHLTMAQKRALNDLLRVQVIEVREPSANSVARGVGPMRIGHSQTDRAEKLGVSHRTVADWDAGYAELHNQPDGPTHAIDKRGRPQPLTRKKKDEEGGVEVRRFRGAPERPEPLRKSRPIPSWSRHYSNWLRNSARPEDRVFLRRLDRELHAALERTNVECEKGNVA